VTEAECLPGAKVGGDFLLVDRGLDGVGQFDQEDVGAFGRVGDGKCFETVDLGLVAACAPFLLPAAADDDFESADADVGGLRLALDALADHGDRLSIEERCVDVGVSINLFHDCVLAFRVRAERRG
jgi:hypothetical protein